MAVYDRFRNAALCVRSRNRAWSVVKKLSSAAIFSSSRTMWTASRFVVISLCN